MPAGANALASRRSIPSRIWRMPRSVRPARVAEFKDGTLTVWTHSQGVFPLRHELVKALKLPPQRVRCIHVEGSGCYGHNGADDVALDAALLARAAAGRPVRLQWMRDDEFAWEPYGSAMVDGGARRRSTPTAASSTGTTSCGATPIRCGRRPTTGTNRAGGLVSGRAAAARARRASCRSRPAAATATRCRSTTSRTSGSCITSSRRCRSGSRRCARSAPTPTCSRIESFMDELALLAAPIRWRSDSRT